MAVTNPETKTYSWRVEATIPAETSGRPYRANINLQVIADTLEEAVEATKQRYPDVRFVKVMTDRYIADVIDGRGVGEQDNDNKEATP